LRTVTNLQDFDFLVAGGSGQRRNVAIALLEQGALWGNQLTCPRLVSTSSSTDDLIVRLRVRRSRTHK
jgi:hypothetical protein